MNNQIEAKTINTLEAQGKELGKAWRKIERGNRKQITDFDLPLGNLLIALRAENDGSIAQSRLKECGIDKIDRRRRSEAEKLANNWVALQPYLKRFTSTSAMLKQWQADNKPVTEPKPVEPSGSNDEPSDVGQTEQVTVQEVKAFTQMNAEEIAFEALLQCEVNNIPVKEFMLALKDQLQLVDQQAVA